MFPPGLVDEGLARAGVSDRKTKRLPGRVLTYFILGCALWQSEPQDEVFAQLTEGLWWGGGEEYEPSPSSLSDGRAKIGPEPLKFLFDAVKGPIASPESPGAFWLDRRVVAIDGTLLDLQDTPGNEEVFGRGSSKAGPNPFPQARVLAAIEGGTQGLTGAVIGPFTFGEQTLLRPLLRCVRAGDVLLCDRNFLSYTAWRDALATGADLVWRAKDGSPALPVAERLDDGSWLSRLRPPRGKDGRGCKPITVRVCEYAMTTSEPDGLGDGQASECVIVVTNILDPEQAGVEELAQAYGMRYPIAEGGIGAFKTLQRGSGTILRSRKPDGVYQEIYAILAVYQGMRRLICQAVEGTGIAPSRVPFSRALKEARRQVRRAAARTPGRLAKAVRRMKKHLLKRLHPIRDPRSWPRTLKRAWQRYPGRKPGYHGGAIHREITPYRLNPQPSG